MKRSEKEMNDIERFKLEKKYVPLVDKYSIILFILGLGSVVLIGSNKISILLAFSYFLVKIGVYVYTTQFSIGAKIKEKKRMEAANKLVKDELNTVKEALEKNEDVEIEVLDPEDKN